MPSADSFSAALLAVRAQIADYEREGTSTPGKLKRAARLRASRMALRDAPSDQAERVAALKLALNEIEKAEKDDNWRRLAELVQELLRMLDAAVAPAG